MNHSHPQRRILFGAFVIIIGALALADNLGLFSAQRVIRFWPMVFILFGAMKVAQTRCASGYVMGGALITAGVLMTLSNIGVIYFNMRDWWPAFLIIAGIVVVARGQGCKPAIEVRPLPGAPASAENSIDAVAIMSGNKFNVVSQDFRGGEATALMGGVEIDMRQASIQSEAALQVFAMWGGIVLKVPTDWAIVCNGVPIMGGIDDKTVPPATPAKRLVINGFILMGGVEIKN